MPDAPYTKREIDLLFDGVHEKLDLILEQTTKTNGRVTACERELSENRGKAKVAGVLWGGFTAVVVSVITFFIKEQV